MWDRAERRGFQGDPAPASERKGDECATLSENLLNLWVCRFLSTIIGV